MHYATIINLDFHIKNTIKWHSLDTVENLFKVGLEELNYNWVSVSESHTSVFNVGFCLYGTYVCTSRQAQPAQLYTV